jgi:hypothetical protein
MNALQTQVGGNHYAKQKIQPFEFTMANGWDSCAHSILKYVHRHPDKGGVEDLRKALHIVDIRDALKQPTWKTRAFGVWNGLLVVLIGTTVGEQDDPRIAAEVYVSQNRIPEEEGAILLLLEQWVRSQQVDQRRFPAQLKTMISDLMFKHYGVNL